jgi:glycosyltransferase involved in cell wall biosynthesis
LSASAGSVSVVVPSWDGRRRGGLAACVEAIGRQTRRPEQTIVVVDHNPELLAWARRAMPAVEVLANRYERGVVGTRNTGVEAARGDVVVLTDDDTEADPRWIESLGSCFSDPVVVGVTGNLVPAWEGPEPPWFPAELYWALGCSYAGLPTKAAPVRNPIAANMAVRGWAIEEVGGFRPGVAPRQIRVGGRVIAGGHALEDTELGIRIGRRRPEMSWLYQPRATVLHTVDAEQATFGYLLRRSFEEGAAKAALARQVGAGRGLESERRYLRATIPRGIGKGLRDALGGDPWGAARAGAIALGIAAAGCGYALASLRSRR